MLAMIDVLGPECKVRIKNKDKYKSNTGGVLTIIFIILSILAFFAFGRDIYEKQSPVVTFNKAVNKGYEASYFMTRENFAFRMIILQ
jgi:hypothetical protein